jgi:hypothetical protein
MSEFSERIADLKELMTLSQKIAEEAYKKRGEIHGAINWGDLGTTDAQHCIDVSGRTFFRIIIEEASPDASELRDFVSKRLAEEGWQNVDVELEW